jgi:hypothetical protein
MTGSLSDNKEAVVRRIGSIGVAAPTPRGRGDRRGAVRAPAEAAFAGLVRVDQVGYRPGDATLAYLTS